MIETRTGEPLIGIWFGNFYRPAYDDRAFVDESVAHLHRMGFNTIQLDSKAWEDFFHRCEGGKASAYVAQQEYMMQAIEKAELSYHFLALYLNCDNLYPNIRFDPPVYGESVTKADGSDGRWYKYWSPKAQDSMELHVRGMMARYGGGVTRVQSPEGDRPVICSMWDPVVAPSFDADGQSRYLSWLRRRYGDIAALNSAYGSGFNDFDELRPEDWWFAEKYGDEACYTLRDRKENTPTFALWADNMRWRADELTAYFADMNERLHAIDKQLLLMPCMAQWGHFLNVDTRKLSGIGFSDLWDTAMRGADYFRLKPYVDVCFFYSVPITPGGDPDAYVLSCQHAMIRAMNPGRDFLGGVYWGRFLYQDVYRFLSPAEIIGSIVLSGAKGYNSYGWCGMDDGGVLHRQDEGFTHSLTVGNHWARRVIPKLTGDKHKDIAILFPQAMALLEPLRVEGADRRRLELLGLFRHACDHGYAPDIVDADAVKRGDLLEYAVLLVPADDCYHVMPDEELEAALRNYVEAGGVIVHGPDGEICEAAFGLVKKETTAQCYHYSGEGGLLLGDPHFAYEGEAVADWRDDEGAALALHTFGCGKVYSFGFGPGYQYAAKPAPHVPLSQRNNELYPFTHMLKDPLAEILATAVRPVAPVIGRDVETACYGDTWVIVNHSPHPIALPNSLEQLNFQYDVDKRTLMGHSAVTATWEKAK